MGKLPIVNTVFMAILLISIIVFGGTYTLLSRLTEDWTHYSSTMEPYYSQYNEWMNRSTILFLFSGCVLFLNNVVFGEHSYEDYLWEKHQKNRKLATRKDEE